MKKILLISLFAAPLTFADISLGSGTQATAAQAPAADAGEYIAMAHEVLNEVKELSSILNSVTDTATADAAAPRINETAARLLALQAKSEALPRPGAEVELQLRNSMNMQEVQQVASEFLGAVIRLGMNNAYGSEALLNALAPIMNAMPGGVAE